MSFWIVSSRLYDAKVEWHCETLCGEWKYVCCWWKDSSSVTSSRILDCLLSNFSYRNLCKLFVWLGWVKNDWLHFCVQLGSWCRVWAVWSWGGTSIGSFLRLFSEIPYKERSGRWLSGVVLTINCSWKGNLCLEVLHGNTGRCWYVGMVFREGEDKHSILYVPGEVYMEKCWI